MHLYENRVCHVATMHKKEEAIAPSFESLLGMKVFAAPIDTDRFGTFSGEVERKLPPLECAKEKCLAALANLKEDNYKGCLIASEGSFGPHPFIPFVVGGREILYFKDCGLTFDLAISEIVHETNYTGRTVADIEAFKIQAVDWGFPSHALIVRPNKWKTGEGPLFKGVSSIEELELAFVKCRKASSDAQVWIETDMRAHKNPTRMASIGQLSEKLARRLSCFCPVCETPGWGIVRSIGGLPCSDCGMATELIAYHEWGCTKCTFREKNAKEGEAFFADPRYCPGCNP